jgi:hypothetical protein
MCFGRARRGNQVKPHAIGKVSVREPSGFQSGCREAVHLRDCCGPRPRPQSVVSDVASAGLPLRFRRRQSDGAAWIARDVEIGFAARPLGPQRQCHPGCGGVGSDGPPRSRDRTAARQDLAENATAQLDMRLDIETHQMRGRAPDMGVAGPRQVDEAATDVGIDGGHEIVGVGPVQGARERPGLAAGWCRPPRRRRVLADCSWC